MVSPHTVDVSAINDKGGTLPQASRLGNHRGRAMGVHIGMIAKPENTVENGLANALYLSWAGASSSMSSSPQSRSDSGGWGNTTSGNVFIRSRVYVVA